MKGEQELLFEGLDVDGRRENDFYRTPRWMTQALLRRISLRPGCRVFLPCVGDGAVANELPLDLELDVVSNDIVAREPWLPDFLLDATLPTSWARFMAAGPIDVVIDNPTFELTFPIAQEAVARSLDGVILLQRCTWPEPTEERDEWLAANPPSAEIRMPRWNFRTVDGKGGSDSACPSWFIWNRARQLCPVGLHIVTRRERDELVALYRNGAVR
jgi:hypothetical protein